MRIVCLQHVDYERPEAIERWANERGHSVECVQPLFEQYPDPSDTDMVVVMGGPMGAYEDGAYPWLAAEVSFIRSAIDAGRLVFGVCLGAQLTARALGGSAHPHTGRELGWFPARLTVAGRESRMLSTLPRELVVGLWHGDTYDLPAGLQSGMVTDACPNQAFEAMDGRVVGVQFHLEWTREALRVLAEAHPDWFEQGGPYVQSFEQFVEPDDALERGHEQLFRLLDAMEAIR